MFAASSLVCLAQETAPPPEGRGGRGGGAGRGPMRSPAMRILDADGDGVLSAAEIQGAGAKFGKLDVNQDGKLAESEVRPAFGPPPPTSGSGGRLDDALAGFMRFDRNGDGALQKEEVPERMHGIFARADSNQDGILSREELSRVAAPGAGPSASGEERGRGRAGMPGGGGGGRGGMSMMRMDPVMRALDADQDGEITATEWNAAPRVLVKLDTNGDGQLTPDELRPGFPGGAGRQRRGDREH